MTLQDILEEIQEKTANTLFPRSIVRKVDNLQREIFRRWVKVRTWVMMDLEAGQPVYPLPCHPSRIVSVIVGGREYDNDPNKRGDAFYYIMERTLNLFPTPDMCVRGGLRVIYYKEPAPLSLVNINAEPDLDRDFHMLLVHGVCKDVVSDASARSWHSAEYERILSDFIRANREPGELIMRVE